MLHIDVICIGKLKETFFKDAILEYSKRLSKYCYLNIIELPDEKIPNNATIGQCEIIKQKETKNIISHIKKESYTFCLDLKGREYSSETFSEKIESISLNYNSHITFIIGGSLGLSPEIFNYANESICFSKMTFPHQLIRIFLLEQIYRAFKISNNETYHK